MRVLRYGFVILAITLAVPAGRADPIHDAANRGDVAAAKALLAKDARLVHAVDESFGIKYTPLHWAAYRDRKAMAELLLSYKADVQARTGRGETPLHLAVWVSHTEMAELLLGKGARLDIYTATGLGREEFVRQALKKNKALARAKGPWERTPLHWAACTGQTTMVELLLDAGADLDGRDEGSKETPLHIAVQNDRIDVVKLLLRRRAKVGVKDGLGQTPLHLAARYGRRQIAELLLEHGADVNAKADIMELLINAFDTRPSLSTPLHEAADRGHREMVELLLARGADVRARDQGGNTPLNLAIERNHSEVASLLRQRRNPK